MFNRSKLRRANVHFLSAPIKDGTTGTVIVLTTPDAHRTMLSYQVGYIYATYFYLIYKSYFFFFFFWVNKRMTLKTNQENQLFEDESSHSTCQFDHNTKA